MYVCMMIRMITDNSAISYYHASHTLRLREGDRRTIQHNTTQYNTRQDNTIQHNTRQYNTTQYKTTQYKTTLHNITQHNTTQHTTTHTSTQHNTHLAIEEAIVLFYHRCGRSQLVFHCLLL